MDQVVEGLHHQLMRASPPDHYFTTERRWLEAGYLMMKIPVDEFAERLSQPGPYSITLAEAKAMLTPEKRAEERRKWIDKVIPLLERSAAYEREMVLRRAAKELDRLETEQRRREEWARAEAYSRSQKELRRQRKALQQGHETLTALRRHLRHAAPSSRRVASEPARTSPTS